MARRHAIPEVCQRIAKVRNDLYGPRGKAGFAKKLGISPSTYNYYESARIPPAELLVRIADLGGVDLRWLLTGQSGPAPVPAGHPAVTRIARLLADSPKAAQPLGAFVDLLSESLSWPRKSAEAALPSRPEPAPAQAGEPATAAGGPGPSGAQPPPSRPMAAGMLARAAGRRTQDWIPILGRSAAGVPQFWTDAEEGTGVTMLEELVRRYARRPRRQVTAGLAADDAGGGPQPVQIVTLEEPDEANVAEFIVAGRLKRKFPDAFAVRLDGDSMSPEIRHGDIVVCSPSFPAADGSPAVVQLAGQIGVTCKLYRRQGQTVHLVPINEQYPPQSFPAGQVVWAKRVLARVRPAGKEP
jgi:transcriptional regulator with XRE-family HTH domain